MQSIMKHDVLNEKVYNNVLSSGLKCYIIPKEGYSEKYAMIGTNFGSINNKFEVDNKTLEVPDGIAHYLEHKLFEDPKKDIMYEFSKIGGNVNAFTNNSNTAYYFSCSENFNENYKLLLDMVSNPHFTDENVEKERGIIDQEIRMYEDYPFINIYLNMLDKMYLNSPIKKNIAGTTQTIKKITKELLYDCYNSFYYPENMAVILVGDFDSEEIYKMTNAYLKVSDNKKVKTIFEKESDNIVSDYVEKKMCVASTMFNLGFKETNFTKSVSKKMISSKLLIDILFGESSNFYEKMYNKNLIDNSFGGEYTSSGFYGSSVVGGISQNPKEVRKYVLEEINKYTAKSINEDRFLQVKKKHIGRFIKEFNSLDNIAMIQLDLFSKKIEICDMMDEYMSIELNEINERLKEHLTTNNNVLSVILPE